MKFTRLHIVFTCLAIILCCFIQNNTTFSQVAGSSKGKDFWLTFMPNVHRGVGATPGTQEEAERKTDSLYIFIASEIPTKGSIVYRDINRREFTRSFTINNPNEIYTFSVLWENFELQGFNTSNQLLANGGQTEKIAAQYFHITSEQDITVYALNQAWTTSDAFLVLPRPALERDYMIMSYPTDNVLDDRRGGLSAGTTPSQCAIIAVEDNTRITIDPSAPLLLSGLNPSPIVLNKGDVYLIQALPSLSKDYDLTGTSINSSKPIAVFAGHQRARIPWEASDQLNSRDCLVEQMVPTANFGKSAFLTPYPLPSGASPIGWDVYRVLAALDSTAIYVDSIKVATLNQGQYFTGVLSRAAEIYSNKPFMVAQYKKTSSTSNTGLANSDPFMMIIPPFEQFLTNYRFISAQAVQLNGDGRPSKVYNYQYVNVVAPQNAINSIVLDGTLIPSTSFSRISKTNFYYATLNISDGVHSISATEPIGIYVYGYGPANSYGYIGGMSFTLFDFHSPSYNSRRECSFIKGMVFDTLAGDSRIASVVNIADSQINTSVSIAPFTKYADSVSFDASLIDSFKDGYFVIAAQDSAGYNSIKKFAIPGFTVRLAGNGIPLIIDQEIPVKKSFCFPITLINEGNFSQTISSADFLGLDKNFTISGTSFPINLQSGGTKEILICYKADSAGDYTQTLSIGDTCRSRTIADITFRAKADTKPPVIISSAADCGLPAIITIKDDGITDSGLEFVGFIDSLTENCDYTIKENGSSSIVSINVKDPYQDANYTLMVKDSIGNISIISDTIPGLTISISLKNGTLVNELNYDTTLLGNTICDTIIILNYGRYGINFPSLFMMNNIAFSIPPEQLPIRLSPLTETRIAVCYHPIEAISALDTIDRDTLAFYYSCASKFLPLSGKGISIQSENTSQCDIQLKFNIAKLPGLMSLPNPHPIIDISKVDFGILTAGKTVLQIRSVFNNTHPIVLANGVMESGHYQASFSSQDLHPGIYLLELLSADGYFHMPIIINP